MAQTDLHMHSAVSVDGEISPRGLAELCCQEGVTLAALTDHNDIAGTAEFIWRCAQLGVQAIPGIELDCVQEGKLLHLLGYGIDIANALLLHTVQAVRVRQTEAGLRLMDTVSALGIAFDREQVLEWAGDGAVCAETIVRSALQMPENRTHPLIRPLLPGDTLSDRPIANFYWSVFAPGKPAYVPVDFMTAEQAVDLIHAAGGIAVLAHPGIPISDAAALDGALRLPLDGVEVFSSYHTAEQVSFYVQKAKEYGLLLGGGSDFHGRSKPDIRIGAVDWQGCEGEARAALLDAVQHVR
ncbi:PHP domain-containing protein [uncultured Agathobaculum sp.]|uniref:PHP domain-containing protein n=1 Tax=uncultured Agathobaculum sp. TaxID=2048140 RepID=UPI0026262D01|nr:PHP domain-containing protein [uncultured Agathobaculum sp.]